MWFWWFMFVCNMLYSLTMIIGGRVMWKHCPEEYNRHVGYRSGRSVINKDTWHFANENCGKRWYTIGCLMLIPTVLVQIPVYGKDNDAVGSVSLIICIVECAVMLLSMLPTEKALKQTFNEDGTRINPQDPYH